MKRTSTSVFSSASCFQPVEPGADCIEAAGIDGVDSSGALGAIDDEAGRLEHLEVLRDGGTADVHPLGDLADGARAGAQALQHRSSRRIAEGIEDELCVSRHER